MSRFNHPLAPNTSPEQSNRSTTPGGISWKKVVAFSVVPLALLFGAAFQSSNSVPGQLQAIQTQLTGLQSHITGLESQNSGLESQISGLEAKVDSLANKGPRKFYLTKTVHDGAHALSACAVGYHMASMWEIHEPSNLRYNTDLGHTLEDSGFGPPNSASGWIRTGLHADVNDPPGNANCSAWTSAGATDRGTIGSLPHDWSPAGTTISPWTSLSGLCSLHAPVWCVQD